MAASGAKVLQLRSVEFARNHGVRLHVRSTFTDDDGTWIREEDERMLEKAMISGVTHTLEEAVYAVEDADSRRALRALADAAVNVDTIIQTAARSSSPPRSRTARTTAAALERLGAEWSERDDLGKVSIVGAGMKSHPGIAARTFAALRRAAASSLSFVATSPIKIAFYVRQEDVERAVKALHETFELSSPRPSDSTPDVRIGVVGATGAVGTVTLALLAERGFENVRAFASTRSAGRHRRLRRTEIARRGGNAGRARRRRSRSVLLLGRAPTRAASWCRMPCDGGAVCIDKSDAYRLTDGVPLVVAGVNDDALDRRPRSSRTRTARPCSSPVRSSRCRGRRARPRARWRRTSRPPAQATPASSGCRRSTPADGDLAMDWDLDGEEFSEECEAARRDAQDPRAARPAAARHLRARPGPGRARQAVWVETEEPLTPGRGAQKPWPRVADRARGAPDAGRRCRPRRRARRPHPPRHAGERAGTLDRERQPTQGRSPERGPDRRASARAAATGGVGARRARPRRAQSAPPWR